MTAFIIGFIGGLLFFVVLGWNIGDAIARLWKPRRRRRPPLTVIVNGRVWREQTRNVHPIYPN